MVRGRVGPEECAWLPWVRWVWPMGGCGLGGCGLGVKEEEVKGFCAHLALEDPG